jgi:hypothetical protein
MTTPHLKRLLFGVVSATGLVFVVAPGGAEAIQGGQQARTRPTCWPVGAASKTATGSTTRGSSSTRFTLRRLRLGGRLETTTPTVRTMRRLPGVST